MELNKRQAYQRDEPTKTSGNVNQRASNNSEVPTPGRQQFRRSQTRGELEMSSIKCYLTTDNVEQVAIRYICLVRSVTRGERFS